jgi:hypothetical protein
LGGRGLLRRCPPTTWAGAGLYGIRLPIRRAWALVPVATAYVRYGSRPGVKVSSIIISMQPCTGCSSSLASSTVGRGGADSFLLSAIVRVRRCGSPRISRSWKAVGLSGTMGAETGSWQQNLLQYHELNVRDISAQSIVGLCLCSHGRPKMRGVSGESLVTKNRQFSSWPPINMGRIVYRVIFPAFLPSANNKVRWYGVGHVVILFSLTMSSSIKARAVHPQSTRPLVVTGLCARRRVVWTRSDLLSTNRSCTGSFSSKILLIQ